MWGALVALIIGLLKWLASSSVPTLTEGAGSGDLEAHLREKIKKDGWS